MTPDIDPLQDRWITAQLAPYGERPVQVETVRTSPVSRVVAVQTERRRCYFKTCGATFAHEPPLTAALAEWFPGSVPDVIAADTEQHWLLLADAGPTVRTLIREDGDRSRSDEMLRQFATLQRESAAYAGPLLALGVPDRRLERLPALYDQIVADTPALLIDQPDGMPESDADRLRAFGPELRALCEQVAACGLPVTLQHDDFHTGNCGVIDGRYAFYDWGEAFVAHPFYSLLIALRDAKFILDYGDSDLVRMRDAYLSVWLDFASMRRLRECLALTHRLAALGRALTWWSVLKAADDAYRAENGDAVPYWLLTFLNDTPLE